MKYFCLRFEVIFFTRYKIIRHGADSITFFPKGDVLRIFIDLKIPSPWPGLNSRNFQPQQSQSICFSETKTLLSATDFSVSKPGVMATIHRVLARYNNYTESSPKDIFAWLDCHLLVRPNLLHRRPRTVVSRLGYYAAHYKHVFSWQMTGEFRAHKPKAKQSGDFVIRQRLCTCKAFITLKPQHTLYLWTRKLDGLN
jgi:hypothetical protein